MRAEEHLANAKNKKKIGKSSLNDHLINSNHPVNECTIQIFGKWGRGGGGRKMNFLEQFEISQQKNTGNPLNSQIKSELANLILPPSIVRRMTTDLVQSFD